MVFGLSMGLRSMVKSTNNVRTLLLDEWSVYPVKSKNTTDMRG